MKVVTRKVQWNPVTVPDLKGYNLYYASGSAVLDHNAPFVYVGNVTEVVITDVIPAAINWNGDYTLGVSAVDNVGNESNIAAGTSFFDFQAPPSPTGFTIL